MSEAQDQQSPTPSQPNQEPTATGDTTTQTTAPAFDAETMSKQIRTQLTEELGKQFDSKMDAEVDKRVQGIFKKLSGEGGDDKKKPHAVHQYFAEDPVGFVRELAQTIREDVHSEYRKEQDFSSKASAALENAAKKMPQLKSAAAINSLQVEFLKAKRGSKDMTDEKAWETAIKNTQASLEALGVKPQEEDSVFIPPAGGYKSEVAARVSKQLSDSQDVYFNDLKSYHRSIRRKA